jgi:hypothetical protein
MLVIPPPHPLSPLVNIPFSPLVAYVNGGENMDDVNLVACTKISLNGESRGWSGWYEVHTGVSVSNDLQE